MTATCPECCQSVHLAGARIGFHRDDGRVCLGSWVRERRLVRGRARYAHPPAIPAGVQLRTRDMSRGIAAAIRVPS